MYMKEEMMEAHWNRLEIQDDEIKCFLKGS